MFRVFIVGVAAWSMSQAGFSDNNPVLVNAPVEKVFVPSGFDDNDKIELVVHGHFNSSCYKMGPVSASVDEASKVIKVTAQAYYYHGSSCIQMVTPFIKSVELLHHLASGTYKISVDGKSETVATALKVAKATRPDADDYLYASVASAGVETNEDGDKEFVLRGIHPYLLDGCVKFAEVRSYMGLDHTIVVQPITRIAYGDECNGSDDHRFQYRQKITENYGKGEFLLHVRVLDGNSVNQLLKFD